MTRILVVDDDPDFCEIARLILTSAHYEVETAPSGDVALRRVKECPPDLILLDVMMRGILDGVHVARTLEEEGARHIPIIMISSITNSPMAGMFPTDEYLPIDLWLSKPVQPQDLLAKVRRLVGEPSLANDKPNHQ
ncbi:MAG: response regulator [Chloroflexi bacterium]|nr:response regulator [Chloroflexota bacterium]